MKIYRNGNILGDVIARALMVEARLVKKHNDENDREEWALVSKKDSSKVLKWFGPKKPSDEAVQKREREVQYFKNH